jgi:hypothetical protein
MNIPGVARAKDYICPLSQGEPTIDLIGGDARDLLVPDPRHVGLMGDP